MVPTSIIEKLKTIFNTIVSSSFFFIALIIAIVLLILIMISLKKYKKVNTKLFIVSWIFIIIALIVKYYEFMINLLDSFIENIFMAIYFPNFAVFTIVLLITNISLFHSSLKKDKDMIYKIIQITSAILIDLLFILILDTTAKNNIDIYSQTEVYQNNELFVLLESSMAIFTVNVILNMIVFIIKKLLNYKTIPQSQGLQQEKTPVSTIQQSMIEEPKSNSIISTNSKIPAATYTDNIVTNQSNHFITHPNSTIIAQNTPSNMHTSDINKSQYQTKRIPEANIVPAVNNINRVNNSFINNTNNISSNQNLHTGINPQSLLTNNVKIINNNNSIPDTSAQFNNVSQQNEFMPISNSPQTSTIQAPSILNANIPQSINTNQNINQPLQSPNNSNVNCNNFISQNNQNDKIEQL